MTHCLHKQSGFTLIEVLIALFISAIVMAVATQTLRTIQMHSVHVQNRQQIISRFAMDYLILQQDITHLRHIPLLNGNGATVIGTENTLTFTRAIPALTNNHIISDQVEVSYVFNHNTLSRTLRDAQGQTMVQTVFIKDDIHYLHFSYYINQAHANSLHLDLAANRASRIVIQLDLDSRKLGHIQWLFEAPDSEPNQPSNPAESNPDNPANDADNDHSEDGRPNTPNESQHNTQVPPANKATPGNPNESDPDDTI